tara:strand:+ start:85 stop:264 length:180 start_codon:yes stop_codon:yes gene_type:complete
MKTDKFREATRDVDATMDADGREAYLAIGERAQIEAVYVYASLGVGLHMYRISRAIARS